MAGVEKSNTTIYHPMGNGQVERFNRTLLEMLGTLQSVQKANWKTHIPTIVHAYNCTRHESTGFSPFYLLFGRQPRIPIDLLLGSESSEGGKSYEVFVASLRERLRFAYGLAQSKVTKAQAQQKSNFDLRARNNRLFVGDRVLVRNVGLKGKNKLADRWKEDVYIVQAQTDEQIPVYQVKLEHGKGKLKTLHRNLLLPIGHIPVVDTLQNEAAIPTPCRPIPAPRRSIPSPPSIDEEESDILIPTPFRPIPAPRKPIPAPSKPILVTHRSIPSTPSIDPVIDQESGLDQTDKTWSTIDSESSESHNSEVSSDENDHQEVHIPISTPNTPIPATRRSKRKVRPPDRFNPSAYHFHQKAEFVAEFINHVLPVVFDQTEALSSFRNFTKLFQQLCSVSAGEDVTVSYLCKYQLCIYVYVFSSMLCFPAHCNVCCRAFYVLIHSAHSISRDLIPSSFGVTS
jgi:hypothetical protein